MDWEHGRRAVGISAAHWEPEGLTDYNPKSLTRSVAPGCWCVIFSSSTVNSNRACHGGPFTGKMYRSAQNPAHTSHPVYRCLHVLALFTTSLVSIETYLPCWYSFFKVPGKLCPRLLPFCSRSSCRNSILSRHIADLSIAPAVDISSIP